MIVGTAGHVDHGKTLLVKALTGIDTDRLKEEKRRGITIDLGFAYLPLVDGGTIGFVDVPGHERLVHTMLAGAACIDLAILVVAADDGVMPQTREHLAIIDLLGISRGIVALTKADLVDDRRLAESRSSIEGVIAGTSLCSAPIVVISSVTGWGIAELKSRLAEEARSPSLRRRDARLRITVDRSFTLAGAGTIVTGAIVSGAIAVGDRAIILPRGIEARVRGLHSMNKAADLAQAGERCALNLTGADVTKSAVKRGDWIVSPGDMTMTERFDGELLLLRSEAKPLQQWSAAHLYVGASSMLIRVVLLSADRLEPGRTALAQFVLPHPMPLRVGDRIVLRDGSDQRTIGGGVVLDPRAPSRRRRSPERIALLQSQIADRPADALRQLLAIPPWIVDLDAFCADRSITEAEMAGLQAQLGLTASRQGTALYCALPASLDALRPAVVQAVAAFHADVPAEAGIPIDQLRRALVPRLAKPVHAALLAMLAYRGDIVVATGRVRLPGHRQVLDAKSAGLWAAARGIIERQERRPPQVRAIAAELGRPYEEVRRMMKSLARRGELVEVASDRFFMRTTVLALAAIAEETARESGSGQFTAAEFKDRAGCGRNIGIELLEYFDRRGFTVRRGDARRWVKSPMEFEAPGPEMQQS